MVRERIGKMLTLKIKGNEYKVKFGYNSFCDTDLMDRTTDLLFLFKSNEAKDDKDVLGMGKIKELFVCVRSLLYVGFKKYNPVETEQEVGDLLDDYKDEETENDKHGLLELFGKLAEELMNEGFFGELMNQLTQTIQEMTKKPKKK